MNKKITLLMFSFLFVVSIGQKISAQQIFSNGPISTGTTTTGGSVAPTGYTWSELQTPNTSLGSGAIYNNALTSDFALADEFVVPVGQIWNLTSIDFFGYQTSYTGTTIPIDVLRVRIWSGDPALSTSTIVFGNMTTNLLNTANSGEAFMYRTSATVGTTRKIWKFNANVTASLPAGTYWVEMQVHAINDGSIFFPPVTILNTLSNTSWNAKQRTATAWANLMDGGSGNTLAFPFNINGAMVLSAEKNQFESNVLIYPNPVENKITISDGSNSSDGLIEVFDVTGRLVESLKSSFSTNVILDVSGLNSGNYILKLQSENGIAVKKFVKL